MDNQKPTKKLPPRNVHLEPDPAETIGFARHNDIVRLCTGILSNPEYSQFSPMVIVNMAINVLAEIESRAKK